MLILPWGANILANKVSQIFNSDPVAQKKMFFFWKLQKGMARHVFMWHHGSETPALCMSTCAYGQ